MRRTLSAALVCLALFTSGCAAKGAGGSDAGPAAAAPSVSAVATTEADHAAVVRKAVEGVTTARTAYRWEVGQAGGKVYAVTGKGSHDFARRQGALVVSLEEVARFEQVFTPERLYIRGSAGAESVGWTFVDRAGVKGQRLLKTPGNDPEFLLRQVVMAEGYQRVAVDDVDGVSAALYRGMLPHAALTLDMADAARKQVDQMRDMLGAPIPVTADAWIDERGRLVRVRLEMDLQGSVRSTTELTLTGLGEPVKVKVPAGAVEGSASSLV
ncbi:hypothetical protein [Streptomyces sp. NPDC048659]|uniref:hypothetical protein n=1 Tax=Streptomyces sp. NPDC048659 TaxID=3155489 RepID=UPI003431D50C